VDLQLHAFLTPAVEWN